MKTLQIANYTGKKLFGVVSKPFAGEGGKNVAKTVAGGVSLGAALSAGADYAKSKGHEKTGAGLDVASQAASYAGTGAMIGSVIPGIGTGVGAVVGGGLWNRGLEQDGDDGCQPERQHQTETPLHGGTTHNHRPKRHGKPAQAALCGATSAQPSLGHGSRLPAPKIGARTGPG